MSGCLPDGFFDFRQLLQHQRMVKPTHLTGQYTRFRYNIVRRSARNRTDVDGQIANPAAVDARDGFGRRLDCMQSFLGRECSMGSASGKFRTEGHNTGGLVGRVSDRTAEVEDISSLCAQTRKIKLLDTGAIAFLRSVKQEFNGPVRCTILQNGGHSFQNCTEAGYIVCAEDCRPV